VSEPCSHDRETLFDELYTQQRQPVHAYFLGKTGNAELALDLVQDTFLRVWRSLSATERIPRERRAAWVFSIARNLAIDNYRSRATRRATGEALEREAAVADATSEAADAELVRRERHQTLDLAIQQLPEDLRVVLVLQILGDRTSGEIGELLGRPAGTVRYQLAEARRHLARDLRLQELVNE
jgi:RNA polymerase sigma-70 factor, ECF subfamily